MHTPVPLADFSPAIAQRILARVGYDDCTVIDDLNFLVAWDRGLVPWLSGILRMRQIFRANPIVTAQALQTGQ